MGMFGGDLGAYMACKTEFAHQSNWFPSPIAGLFSYLIWNGYDGFWQNGAVLETITNFMYYANHTRYKNVISDSYRDLYSLLEAYGPYPSFDDMGWYAMAFIRIYEVTGDEEFLQAGIDIFNWCWKTGWDKSKTCEGGMFFDNLFNFKASITNVQMYFVAAKLHRIQNDTDSLHKLKKLENFIFENKMINSSTFLLIDSIDLNCTYNGSSQGWTYESGILVAAFAEMYKLHKNETYLLMADKLAWSTITYNSNGSDIFVEKNCEPDQCNEDQLMYKGIFVRNLRYFLDVLPDQSKAEKYWKWINDNIQHIIKYSICDESPISKCNITFQDGPPYYNKSGPVFSANWIGPFTVGAPMQQTSALDLFVSGIKPGTLCTGKYCDYSPYYPPPQPMTCGSHPCPTDQQCCEYSPYKSYTCCTPQQKCNKDGICV
ncbi:hypothetical protein FSP39_015536 [Pinctada imbricata]|uniref:Uncharacterized protein n=1 Tax=Pinctada imbricata TaxID=66713 RepID=A0AA89C7I5_PINIB|nr:hypothetical protein FSP39_015536 [Pinctada imbricata]